MTIGTPVLHPVMPITEGVHIILTAYEDQSRSPFLQATRSWNLVSPTQNVTLPLSTTEPKRNSTSRNSHTARIPKAKGKVNGTVIGAAVGVVLGILFLLGAVWYCYRVRQKKMLSQEKHDAQSPAPGLLGKLGMKLRVSRAESPQYSISDLESVTSLGGDTHLPELKAGPASRSPSTPPPKERREKYRRSWKDSRVWQLLSPTRQTRNEGELKRDKDDSAGRVGGQLSSIHDRLTPPGPSPSARPSLRSQDKIISDFKGRDNGPIQRSMISGRRETFAGGSGRSETSRRVPLATVRESSPFSQRRRRRLSDPGGSEQGHGDVPKIPDRSLLRPGQQAWPPAWRKNPREASSDYSRPSSAHSSKDSNELEAYLEPRVVTGTHRKERSMRGSLHTDNMPGIAF